MNIHAPDFKNSLFSRDIDVSVSKRLIEIIAKKSNRNPKEIIALTLQSYEKHLSNTLYRNTRNVLIQPLVNRGRLNKRGGQRFCPICLKEDDTPYLRKKWRLSFSTACTKHNVYLEINAQPQHLDLNDILIKTAKESGVRFSIATDAHACEQLDYMHYGLNQARRGWLEEKDVINTLPLKKLLQILH